MNVLLNDSDPDPADLLTVTADVAVTANNGLVACVLGICNYTADPTFHGIDVLTYTVADLFDSRTTGTVTVTVP